MELTQEEMDGIVDVIDGTVETMIADECWDNPDFAYWIGILNKLGEKGQRIAREWLEVGKREAATEAESAALLDLLSKLG